MECFQARGLVLGPVRGLARLITVSRLIAPAANPEPRFRKIILLSAPRANVAPDARIVFSDAGPALDELNELLTRNLRSAVPQILGQVAVVVVVLNGRSGPSRRRGSSTFESPLLRSPILLIFREINCHGA